jgi:23S rRNA (cytidine1920-2'-O)/16S rRNA (cytidine1409-2'-O)-methyltransferase
MPKADKRRLDLEILKRNLAPSRQRAQALIMSGKVLVNQQPFDKPGTLVTDDDKILIRGEYTPYVSRGGRKLEAGLKTFGITAEGMSCLDVGASTGGFTDCLLQHGARKVFAVDVGYGQLAWEMRQNPRVVVIERTNIRYIPFETIGERVDLITVDVSFISLRHVVPAILQFAKPGTVILALIKPQFEVGKGRVGKGGVVRNPVLHNQVLDELTASFRRMSLSVKGVMPSPILGLKGNKEFIACLHPAAPQDGNQGDFAQSCA